MNAPVAEKKKERTIRSETTKVFLVIFVILAFVGVFTIFSAIRGSKTFSTIREVHLKQFKAAEVMKQRALDVIAIYYLLATDQDLELLMQELMRYEGLIKSFDESAVSLEKTYQTSDSPEKNKVMGLLKQTKEIFEELNMNCRQMTFAMMEGKKEESKKHLPAINAGISKFKAQLDAVEKVVEKELEVEANRAQSLLQKTTWVGISITFLAVFITLGLIYYLMKFLSISLLPISNLMHNMRQAVFSIDKNLNIISPVSAYSSSVFGEEIVGKNIYDIAYKEVDLKAEAFSANKMALDVVFGADDLQWMLQEDGLMRQVKRTVGGSEKILKLTYTPLMEKDLVQNIMIVAEDVTEVEKLRAEALKKQAEMEIVKGVIGVEISDLEAFLTGSQNQMIECRSLMSKIENDKESRQLLFRILHTLKGNSRMYKLNAISEVVHIVENTVVGINKQIDSGEEVTHDQKVDLLKGYDEIEDVLALHSKMARKLFGLNDLYSGRVEEQIHRAMIGLENVYFHFDEELSFPEDLEKDMAEYVDQAKKAATYFEKESLVDLTQKISIGSFKTHRDQLLKDFREEYMKLLMQNSGVIAFKREPEEWISLFLGIFEFTSLFESDGISDSVKRDQGLDKLFVIADSLKLGFVKTKVLFLQRLFAHHKDFTHNTSMYGVAKEELSSLWSFMAAVTSLETSFAIDKDLEVKIFQVLSKSEINGDVLDNLTTVKVLPLSFFRSLDRRQVTFQTFITLATQYLKHSKREDAIKEFFGTSGQIEEMEDFFETLRDGTANGFQQALSKLPAQFPMGCLLRNEKYSSQLHLDIMKLILTYKTGDNFMQNEEQTVEIPAICFNEIKTLSLKVSEEFSKTPSIPEKIDRLMHLNNLIQHALDYPIQSLCKKMEPMVSELSKRMGKDILYKVSGEYIALQRDTAYALRDALVHVIRNSLDHGIETPEERVQKGKSPKATIEIFVRKANEFVEVLVRDDGRGIDYEKVAKKALSNGAITEAQAISLSIQEKLELIFLPNLSTKEEVTALSGRGVGMDAVKTTVEELGGRVIVKSEKDRGTEFLMLIKTEKNAEQSIDNKQAV